MPLTKKQRTDAFDALWDSKLVTRERAPAMVRALRRWAELEPVCAPALLPYAEHIEATFKLEKSDAGFKKQQP